MQRLKPNTSRKSSVAACAAAIAASVGLAAAPARAESVALDQVERYCSTSWRHAGIHPQDWSDCTQEAIAQLLQRVPRERLGAVFGQGESPERRELKRAIWRTAQRWRRAPRYQPLADAQLGDGAAAHEAADAADAVEFALRRLSPRQQQILTLWSQGWSIEEIARHLNIPASQASDGKYKAFRKLRACLAG